MAPRKSKNIIVTECVKCSALLAGTSFCVSYHDEYGKIKTVGPYCKQCIPWEHVTKEYDARLVVENEGEVYQMKKWLAWGR